jgi:hypothetical protein
MNTKIKSSLGLGVLMVLGVVVAMLAMGLFTPQKANAAAPTPGAVTASPGSPGDIATIKIPFTTDTALSGNQDEIWVAFDTTFGVPATIAKTSVSIASGQTTGGVSNPLIDPTVVEQVGADSTGELAKGDTIVKIQIGDTNPNSADATVEDLDAYSTHTITFSSSAGITLPTAAAVKEIWLSKDSGTSWYATTTTQGAVGTVSVYRELVLSATSGARGKSVTATGKGFSGTGEVTLWIDTNTDGVLDSGEFIIESGIAVSGGEFESTFSTDTNFPLATNATIQAIDGTGVAIGKETSSPRTAPTFDSYGTVSLDKTEVARGQSLDVTLSDYLAGVITEIKIGSASLTSATTPALPTAATATGVATTGTEITYTITIPSSAPLGSQRVYVDAGENRYTTVTITGAPVTVSPATAVAGQEVTLTGSGFTKFTTANGNEIATITVGTVAVTYISSGGLDTADNVNTVDTDSSGNFTTSFLIPENAITRTAGSHKILVTDDGGITGEVFVTVPGRTLTLSDSESKRGSEITVTGTGFTAKETVNLTYTTGTDSPVALGSSTADAFGAITKVVTIPNSPAIPSSNTLKGAVTNKGSKTATHEIPASSITTDVEEQSTGESVTITGVGFPAFVSVSALTIGGIDARPTPAPSTDVDGGFASTVMVPGLVAGNHPVSVTAGSVTGSTSIKVVATTAEVVAVSTATADVFADSIGADNLVRVWKFSNADQSWSFYDPREAFADANTLANTVSGDIVWVNVTAEESFQSGTLYPGWNLISLD